MSSRQLRQTLSHRRPTCALSQGDYASNNSSNWFWKIAFSLGLALVLANTVLAQVLTPQGRLTLTSNTPVMTGDVTNATAVYYTPYVGESIPISNGTSFSNYIFSQLTMTLNSSNQTSGEIYDLFVFLNSSHAVTIGAGPAWYSSAARCSTACSAQIQQTNGFWVNANSITLTNGGTSYSSIPAGEATYVGTVYMTSSGETGVNFKPSAAAGGSNNTVGIWNAYNRIPISSFETDSNTSWTNTSNSWREMDASTSNRVIFIDGLGQSFVKARVATIAYNATATNGCSIGVLENLTTGAPFRSAAYQQAATGGSTGGATTFSDADSFPPLLGLNYIQAMENSPNSSTCTMSFNGGETGLLVEGEY